MTANRRSAEVPERAREGQVEGLDAAVALPRRVLDEGAVSDWLLGVNAHLGQRRPTDVLRDGGLAEVVAAIEAERSGAFA
jgi:hypothetical protein